MWVLPTHDTCAWDTLHFWGLGCASASVLMANKLRLAETSAHLNFFVCILNRKKVSLYFRAFLSPPRVSHSIPMHLPISPHPLPFYFILFWTGSGGSIFLTTCSLPSATASPPLHVTPLPPCSPIAPHFPGTAIHRCPCIPLYPPNNSCVSQCVPRVLFVDLPLM